MISARLDAIFENVESTRPSMVSNSTEAGTCSPGLSCGPKQTIALPFAAASASFNVDDVVKMLLLAGADLNVFEAIGHLPADLNVFEAIGHLPADVIVLPPKLQTIT